MLTHRVKPYLGESSCLILLVCYNFIKDCSIHVTVQDELLTIAEYTGQLTMCHQVGKQRIDVRLP